MTRADIAMQHEHARDPSRPRTESDGVPSKTTPPGGPIAVVGMACRFPGADDLAAFWRLLESGGNAVTHGSPGDKEGRVGEMFPDAVPVHDGSRFGAFLPGIDQFDAEFFRISPLEAESLDPQQRLLLELSWEALEDAGIAPERLVGSRSGVYVGIGSYEYQEIVRGDGEADGPNTPLYLVTGNRFSTASGRVSFALGLEGPSIAVDTACSSSLVAVHHAVAGLERGEADLALAGGVCVILSPLTTEAFANAGMLSPTGQCWTFDERADGFVRSEGCGMLVLKRLSEAEAAGDRIWGVIRGSAVNQDGERPGLPAPKGLTQGRVIEEALSRAGISPSQVDYLEAHGTGTKLGDPTEVNAAAEVYGRGREPDRPLLMGSVKTNIGHLAAGAGAAGLIKALLAMRRGVIPKHLNLRNPNPEIPWDRLPVRVTTEATDWPLVPGRRPLAGVSSFGFSGTNSHVIVEGYGEPHGARTDRTMPWPAGAASPVSAPIPAAVADLPPPEEEIRPREARILPLSGKTEAALKELAGRYLAWIDERSGDHSARDGDPGPPLADLAWTAGVGRSHFAHRAGIVFRGVESLRGGLAALAEADEGPAPRAAAKAAFAYTGQASQWVGMGRDLYEREPVVRAVLDRCDALLHEERGGSLLDVMFGRTGSAADLDDPKWKQPAIYALECALTALWASVGVRPSVVVGHSLGEIAAAQAAGVFGLEDGLRFAAARGSLIGALPGEGAMAAVFAPASRVVEALDEHNASSDGPASSIAADNGAHQVVSGPAAAIDAIVDRFEAEEVRARRLRTSPAYHSEMVEPALDDLAAALSGIPFSPPSIPFVSNLTGRVVAPGETLDAAYWRRQAREPVAFRACVETVAGLGVDTIVEIGPHAVLGPMASLAWPETAPGTAGGGPLTLASLRRPSDSSPAPAGGDAFVDAVARAYEAGLPIAFEGLFSGEARRRIALPSYPFQRRRHWVDPPKRRRPAAGHPLLGVRHESPHGEVTFETAIFASDPAWVSDHRVFGQVVVPGAMFGTMAATVLWGEGAGAVVLEDCQLHSPMICPAEDPGEEGGEGGRKLQIVFDGSGKASSSRRFEVFSRGEGEDGWTLHLEGRMAPGGREPRAAERVDLEDVKARLTRGDVVSLYRNKVSTRVVLGPSFRPLKDIWSGPGEAVAEVSLPDCLDGSGLDLHPILLDGCFQSVLAARDQARVAGKSTYMPFGWDRLWLAGPPPERVFCHVRMREAAGGGLPAETGDESPEVVKADLRILAPDGAPLGGVDGFTMKRATRAAMLSASNAVKDLLYEVAWRERDSTEAPRSAGFLVEPEAVGARVGSFPDYLAAEGVTAGERAALLADLDRLGRSHTLAAFDALGWRREAGAAVDPDALHRELNVAPEHRRLFRRLLGILADAGVLAARPDGGLAVAVGSQEPFPDEAPAEPEALAERLLVRHPHGSNEIGLLRRCGGALAEVLGGRTDPLSLLFGGDGPGAADLYRTAPAARAATRMLAGAVAAAVSDLPDGRRLRVLEIGAGTGSATEPVLAALPEGRFDYLFTDISAGFFAEAESRFAASGAPIEYRALDIEADPAAQGFDPHGYDLVIAANVLHATRDLGETLAHCHALLAPSGQLIALELVRGRNLQDLTFGLLDGWWRFADAYRPDHALAAPAVWCRALGDAGFESARVLGADTSDGGQPLGPGIVIARGAADIAPPPGAWILAPGRSETGVALAAALASRNQTVVLAGGDAPAGEDPIEGPGVFPAFVRTERRESWRALFDRLPKGTPLQGIVHLAAIEGRGQRATTAEVAEDTERTVASRPRPRPGRDGCRCDPREGPSRSSPAAAQVVEREQSGEIAGATLWGFGKAAVREAAHLGTRMIDLDPGEAAPPSHLTDELLYPDRENHIAYRAGRRHVARLVRIGAGTARIAFPDEGGWRLAPDPGGALGRAAGGGRIAKPPRSRRGSRRGRRGGPQLPRRAARDGRPRFGSARPRDVRTGRRGRPGRHGRGGWRPGGGARVRGLRTRGGHPGGARGARAAGDPGGGARHRPGGVHDRGARIRSGRARGRRAGARPRGGGRRRTCGHPARPGGRRGGVRDRERVEAGIPPVARGRTRLRQPAYHVRRGSPRGDGRGGGPRGAEQPDRPRIHRGESRVPRARRPVRGARRPGYPERGGDVGVPSGRGLRHPSPGRAEAIGSGASRSGPPEGDGTARGRGAVAASPTPAGRWPRRGRRWRSCDRPGTSERWSSRCRRSAGGRLRKDRTYLVTGGLGGIGCAVAGLLADRGAGSIVLNGRRAPDTAARETVRALEERGVTVRVEIADVTDARRGGRDARAGRRGPAAARGGRPQRRGAVGRRAHEPELGAVRGGAPAEGARRLAAPPGDRGTRPRPLRPVSRAWWACSARRARRTTPPPTRTRTSSPPTGAHGDSRGRPSPGGRGRGSARRRSTANGSRSTSRPAGSGG